MLKVNETHQTLLFYINKVEGIFNESRRIRP